MKIRTAKSINVNKTNTLHQFDTVGIVGLQSPVGKVPIVFYVKEAEGRGRRGIVYYDDYDTVCFMFPENKHEEWCKRPYNMKYDNVEPFDNGVESGYRRNHGIFQLWVSVLRKWYNGQVMYRPTKKIKGSVDNNYPSITKTEEVTTVNPKVVKKTPQVTNINHSCGCRK